MKKSIIIAIFAAIFAVSAFQYTQSLTDSSLSMLSMENVEALGYDESEGEGGGPFSPLTSCYREILYDAAQDTRTEIYCVFAKCSTVIVHDA